MLNNNKMLAKTVPLLPLFKKFIRESRSGKRQGFNGKRISNGVLNNYAIVYKQICDFEQDSHSTVVIPLCKGNSQAENRASMVQWRKLYTQYTHYLYQKGCMDNYVGLHIGILRTLFNWAQQYCYLPLRGFSEIFRKTFETIPVVTLSKCRIRQLMDENWTKELEATMQLTCALFLFGCTVGLRYVDLRALTKGNILIVDDKCYLRSTSQKTKTQVCIKLPMYCIAIIDYYGSTKKLLPFPPLATFNHNLKKLGELAGWTEPLEKTRMKNKRSVTLKTSRGKSHRFCDQLSSHIMRKTAITTMLMAGVPEHAVRRLSGHTGNSREFQRCVNYSQAFLDAHTDNTFTRLNSEIHTGTDV